MFDTLDISASGLLAQRLRLDAVAQNIANVRTTHDATGNTVAYERRFAIFMEGRPDKPTAPGVRAEIKKQSQTRLEYETGHRDADNDGYVHFPDIDVAMEYVDALEASRAYEANVTTMEVTKAMLNASLRLLA